MREDTQERVSSFLGWLIVALPLGLLLTGLALIAVMRFGVASGIAYVFALLVWAGLLGIRALRG